MYVIEWMRWFCKCEKEIEFDDDTIEVLKAIYREQNPEWEPEGADEDDSEDEDYEPCDCPSESSESESESEPDDDPSDAEEEIIVKRDDDGNYYLY